MLVSFSDLVGMRIVSRAWRSAASTPVVNGLVDVVEEVGRIAERLGPREPGEVASSVAG